VGTLTSLMAGRPRDRGLAVGSQPPIPFNVYRGLFSYGQEPEFETKSSSLYHVEFMKFGDKRPLPYASFGAQPKNNTGVKRH
jgi:hypothetical protein